VPEFIAACDLWMVEVSEPLMRRQMAALVEAPVEPAWVQRLADVPGGAPVILVANELLDCLPARQFVQSPAGWVERRVGLDADGELAFALAGPAPQGGVILEVSAAQEAFGSEIGALLRRETGAALLIDYGRAEPGFGDTFQALSRHAKVDPLADPGSADLTVHADFPSVLAAAEAEGCATAIAPQGLFLLRLGIEHRAAALARAKPERGDVLHRQLQRLIAPDQMGDLFKAACIRYPESLDPPGFADPV
jgi:SAM-dependent MidA family methyltransferase